MRLAAPLLALLCAAPVLAQEGPPDRTPPGGGQPNEAQTGLPNPSALFSATPGAFFGIGLGKIDGDVYATTILNTDLHLGPVRLGLALPVRLLVQNNEATGTREQKTYGGLIRKRDWDELSDYFQFIRYVGYGYKRDPLYFQVGQLWGSSIGHGTIVHRYANSLQIDHKKTGLALDVNTTFFGFETLTDNVFDPNLVSGRVYLRPFGDTIGLRGWAIGATVAVDRNAPRALRYTSTTQGLQLAQDDKGNPIADFSDAQMLIGVDTEYAVLDNSVIRLVPYVDANRIVGAGNGLHVGVMSTIALPIPVIDVTTEARLEYRVMQAGYIPEYFDLNYDFARFQYLVPSTTGSQYVPKAEAARRLKAQESGTLQGYYGELDLNFGGWVQIGGLMQDYDAPNGKSFSLWATVPKIQFVKVSAGYSKKNFAGLNDAFQIDDRSILFASLGYQVVGPLYLRLDFTRTWVLDPNSTQIKAVDAYNAGVAFYTTF